MGSHRLLGHRWWRVASDGSVDVTADSLVVQHPALGGPWHVRFEAVRLVAFDLGPNAPVERRRIARFPIVDRRRPHPIWQADHLFVWDIQGRGPRATVPPLARLGSGGTMPTMAVLFEWPLPMPGRLWTDSHVSALRVGPGRGEVAVPGCLLSPADPGAVASDLASRCTVRPPTVADVDHAAALAASTGLRAAGDGQINSAFQAR